MTKLRFVCIPKLMHVMRWHILFVKLFLGVSPFYILYISFFFLNKPYSSNLLKT